MSSNINLSMESKEKRWYYSQINHIDNMLKNFKVQKSIEPPKLDDNDNYYFSFTHSLGENRRAIFNQISRIIEEAVKKDTYLLVCSFFINNHEILELIRTACNKLQGKIYIIVGNQQNMFISFNKESECMEKGFSSLVGEGVLIRFVENAHLKFISNGKTSLICSTNFTSEGLFRNPEFGIVIKEENILFALNRLFFYLWFTRGNSILVNDTWVEIPHNSRQNPYPQNLLNLGRIDDSKIIITSKTIINTLNSNEELVNEDSMYDIIIGLLSSAKKSIDIALYGIYFSSNDKLKEIKEILIQKADDSVEIRILVPSVKVNLSQNMKNILEELKKNKTLIKYYKELHGKCIIIDKKSVLIMTGNIDKYLVDDNSFDIGYVINESTVVKNFLTFYDHLWDEGADECNADIPVNLHIDLTIRSYELISFKPLISVRRLKELIVNSQSITLYLYKNSCLLKIKGKNNRSLNLFFGLRDNQSREYSGDTLNLTGIINDKPDLNLKKAQSMSVQKLDIRLFWEV